MVDEIRFISINRILEDIAEHPMLKDLTVDQVVKYTLSFIGRHGYNGMYQDRIATVDIDQYRGMLPCDVIRIKQVRDVKTHTYLRSMGNSFIPGLDGNIPDRYYGELSFKTQGRVIYTTMRKGAVEIAYKAIPVDDDGFPMLVDNETYISALKAFIKFHVFDIKHDLGKIPGDVYMEAKRNYAALAAQLKSEFNLPSVNEIESISRYLTTSIKGIREFSSGFDNLGDREFLKNH